MMRERKEYLLAVLSVTREAFSFNAFCNSGERGGGFLFEYILKAGNVGSGDVVICLIESSC